MILVALYEVSELEPHELCLKWKEKQEIRLFSSFWTKNSKIHLNCQMKLVLESRTQCSKEVQQYVAKWNQQSSLCRKWAWWKKNTLID